MPLTRKIPCIITSIVDHGGGVYTIELEPQKTLPRFLPGQFMHLAVDEYDPSSFWPESRVFSIASRSVEKSSLTISYSVKGKYTTRMSKELAEGANVWVKLPYGEFIIRSDRDIVLVAGGTGITAFTAFLENLTSDNVRDIQLFYGARNKKLLLYEKMISQAAQSFSGLSVHYFLEELPEQADMSDQVYHLGRLSINEIWDTLSDPITYVYYLSGPPEMLKLFSGQLNERGVKKEDIRIDAWE